MNKLKLSLNLESYFFNKTYKAIYFFGKLNNNIIFDNEIVEEKLAKVKVVLKTDKPSAVLESIHSGIQSGVNWNIEFIVDPTAVSRPLNKEGHRVTTFTSQECVL